MLNWGFVEWFEKEFVYCTCPDRLLPTLARKIKGSGEEWWRAAEEARDRITEGAHVYQPTEAIVNAPFIDNAKRIFARNFGQLSGMAVQILGKYGSIKLMSEKTRAGNPSSAFGFGTRYDERSAATPHDIPGFIMLAWAEGVGEQGKQ